MELTTTVMLNADGVDHGPGGPGEDRRDGFERGRATFRNADE